MSPMQPTRPKPCDVTSGRSASCRSQPPASGPGPGATHSSAAPLGLQPHLCRLVV